MSTRPDAVWFAIGLLATWRLTHLVAAEDGPWNVVARLRRAAGGGALGRALDCFYCLSLWIALPAACVVADDWPTRLAAWPALSGGAILLQRATRGGDEPE